MPSTSNLGARFSISSVTALAIPGRRRRRSRWRRRRFTRPAIAPDSPAAAPLHPPVSCSDPPDPSACARCVSSLSSRCSTSLQQSARPPLWAGESPESRRPRRPRPPCGLGRRVTVSATRRSIQRSSSVRHTPGLPGPYFKVEFCRARLFPSARDACRTSPGSRARQWRAPVPNCWLYASVPMRSVCPSILTLYVGFVCSSSLSRSRLGKPSTSTAS